MHPQLDRVTTNSPYTQNDAREILDADEKFRQQLPRLPTDRERENQRHPEATRITIERGAVSDGMVINDANLRRNQRAARLDALGPEELEVNYQLDPR